MTEFINNILDQIQNYNTSISKKATFLDKPWALVDNELEIQKLIFQKDKQLILSKNGKVRTGTWDYLAGAKSMLIDRGSDKILLNEVFINDDVMILKVDGTNHEFFVLANQNTIPNLDVIGYLEVLRFTGFFSKKIRLKSGEDLTLYTKGFDDYNYSGHLAFINNKSVKNGLYETEGGRLFLVKDGEIIRYYYQHLMQNPDGDELRFLQLANDISTAEFVYLNGERIMDREVNYSKTHVLIVKNGKVIKVKRKKSILQSITDLFKKNN